MYQTYIRLAAELAFPAGARVATRSGSSTIYVVDSVTADFVHFRIATVGGGVSLSHIEALTKMAPIDTPNPSDSKFGQFTLAATPAGTVFKYADKNILVQIEQPNLATLLTAAMQIINNQ